MADTKMVTFWIFAPCSLIEEDDVSEVLVACIIRADDGGNKQL
jgi:hypothetical protein